MEDGNVIDMMAGVFMMVCLFAIILTMLAYFALVERRLSINNAIRNYLYLAEQQGGLTEDDKANLKKFLVDNYGCDKETLEIKVLWCKKDGGESEVASGAQVPYGDTIKLSVKMDFPNPIYQVIGLTDEQIANGEGEKYWFRVKTNKSIYYEKSLSSTSRW